MPASCCCFWRSNSASGKEGFRMTSAKRSRRLVEVLYERTHRDARHIQVRPGAERGAEALQCLRYLDGVARSRAFVEHAHRHPRGAGQGELVGGIAGIEQQGEVDDWQVVPPGKDDLEAVVEFHRLSCRKGHLWKLGDLGRSGEAVDGACRSRICGVGPHLHGQDAFVQPFDGDGVDIGDSRGQQVLLLLPVPVRTAGDTPRRRRGRPTCRRTRRCARRRG